MECGQVTTPTNSLFTAFKGTKQQPFMECSFMCWPSLAFCWSWSVCVPCNLCMYPRSIPEVLACAEPDSMDCGWGDQGGGVSAGAGLSGHTGEVQTLRSVHSCGSLSVITWVWVCVCVCIHACVCVRVHPCVSVCVWVYASMHECVCDNVCVL